MVNINFKRALSVIGLIILFLLFYKLGFDNIVNTFRNVNFAIGILLLALLISFISIIPSVTKWDLILRSQGLKIKFWTLFKLERIGTFYGMITPGRIGTFVRVTYLKDVINKKLGFCFGSIVLDKLTDLFAILTLAFVGALLILNRVSGVFLPIILFSLAIITLLIFFSNKERSKAVFIIIYKFIVPKKYKKLARESFHSFYDSLIHPYKLILPFMFSLLSYTLFYSVSFVLSIPFNIKIPFIYFITLFSIATVVGMLPITIAGIGTRELTLVGLFSLFNQNPSSVVAMSLTSFVVGSILPTCLGWYFSLRWNND